MDFLGQLGFNHLKRLTLKLLTYQIVNLIGVTSEVLVDQVEGIPAEKYSFVKGLCFPVCCKGLVHKVSNVKLHSWRESLFFHPRTTIASKGELLATNSFQFIHHF